MGDQLLVSLAKIDDRGNSIGTVTVYRDEYLRPGGKATVRNWVAWTGGRRYRVVAREFGSVADLVLMEEHRMRNDVGADFRRLIEADPRGNPPIDSSGDRVRLRQIQKLLEAASNSVWEARRVLKLCHGTSGSVADRLSQALKQATAEIDRSDDLTSEAMDGDD